MDLEMPNCRVAGRIADLHDLLQICLHQLLEWKNIVLEKPSYNSAEVVDT
jgi:hypothetical protein